MAVSRRIYFTKAELAVLDEYMIGYPLEEMDTAEERAWESAVQKLKAVYTVAVKQAPLRIARTRKDGR